MFTATNVIKKSSPATPHKDSIEKLKNKYELNALAAAEIPKASPQLSTLKISKKSKVKEMASLYNYRISQSIRHDSDAGNHLTKAKMQTKTCCSPNPVSMPQINCKEKSTVASPRSKSKAKLSEMSMSFVSEDNFEKLSVKQKAQLYTQFINDMSKKNSQFGQNAEFVAANIKPELLSGEVIHEKQESVKHLLAELEAKCAFPKQTISPFVLQRINSAKKKVLGKPILTPKVPVKSKPFEDLFKGKLSHTSTLSVSLQPKHTEVKKARKARNLPRQVPKENDNTNKRNNDQMHSSLPFDAYAPPKKIRRTRVERLTPKIFFQNQQLENLFFTWLSERRVNKQQQLQTGKASGKEQIIEKLLEETIAKFKNIQLEEKETCTKGAKENETKGQQNAKLTIQKKRPANTVQLNKINTASSVGFPTAFRKSLKSEESESGLSYLSKIASDESQADAHEKESDNSERNIKFAKHLKPLRKKKLRRTLTWKSDIPLKRNQPINLNSTDSDSSYKLVRPETNEINKAASAELPPQPNLKLNINSPRKMKSAYSLAVFSPTPCQDEHNINDLNSSKSAKHDILHSWPSSVGSSNNKVPSGIAVNTESRSFTDSFIDQGFETGSNDMDSPVRAPKRSNFNRQDAAAEAPLFIRLGPESQSTKIDTENPLSFSTPIKGHSQQPAHFGSNFGHQKLFTPIILPLKNRRKSTYDTEPRRSSLAMQVIREDHPLEHHEMISPLNSNTKEQVFFANAPTLDMSTDLVGLNADKTSQFWIKCGDFSWSLDILYNDAERVRLLYEIFSQKSCDSKDLHFGIDNHKFSVHHLYEQENISKRLPASKESSHYWFSTGDMAIPFSGKLLSAEKIKLLFECIKAFAEENGMLRFGVDAVEFSNVAEFCNTSPKFSMDSNYSMLVGLQSGNSNGLEGRSKFAWPHSKPINVSDSPQTDYGCEDFDEHDSYRLSFSPFSNNHFDLAALSSEELSLPRNSEAMINSEPFGVEYQDESVDNLFDEANEPQSPVPQMVNTLQTQQKRLSLVHEKLSRYNNLTNCYTDALDALKGTPQYLEKLKSIVAEISSKGLSSGFKDCNVQQLEIYMSILSRYAVICLHSCSDYMDTVLDALLDQEDAKV